jgi:hypothetical protein
MSYYYKYNFTSPEIVYSTVKEELKSYFDTGAVDDLMFPTYVDKCLRKLGRSSYIISEDVLYLDDFQARLPDNFYAVREAWMCTQVGSLPYQTANSFYSQTDDPTTILIAPVTTNDPGCPNPDCNDPNCDGGCFPNIIRPVYKTNYQTSQSIRREYLLRPGNISARNNCDVDYTTEWSFHNQGNNVNTLNNFTPGESAFDSFDIRDNKFVTNFRNGIVNLVFYSTDYDASGNQLIPDNYRIREFIEAFIKYKVFETLTNQTNDETFQQLQQKLVYYKQLSEEAFIMADIEVKKQTPWEKQRRIKQDLNRFNMYELPNRTNRYGRRNN